MNGFSELRQQLEELTAAESRFLMLMETGAPEPEIQAAARLVFGLTTAFQEVAEAVVRAMRAAVADV